MSELDPRPSQLVDMLAASAWWSGLDDVQRRRVTGEVEERRFPGGTVVMRKGETVDAWTGVIEGLVKMSSVSAAGKNVTFTGVGAGGWFGEGSLRKREARKYDTVALRAGHRSVLEISQEEIGYLSGVSRQRVNQALQVLARAKLVEVEYGSIRILDLTALRRYGN